MRLRVIRRAKWTVADLSTQEVRGDRAGATVPSGGDGSCFDDSRALEHAANSAMQNRTALSESLDLARRLLHG
ncbi:MAG: hypothetical protein Q8K99_11270 [Actinomycetota bacterium]|nr:hypothetical protein [Actinomycetota bacterium]